MAVKKDYYIMYNIGRVKYLVNFHPPFYGSRKHKDGSKFYSIRTFKNKKKMAIFIKSLVNKGYKVK